MGKTKPKNWVAGRWLIESMDQWDRDFIDEMVRDYFGFTWDGNDEMDPAPGRGWLVLEGDELRGMFYIHLGDESGIVLKREPQTKPKRKRT